METSADVISYVNLALFVVLAWRAFLVWRRQRGTAGAWVALTFGSIAIVAVVGLFLPEEAHSTWEVLAQKLLIGVLLLFPYFLFRFSVALAGSSRTWGLFAVLITVAPIVWTAALPRLPGPSEARPGWFELYIAAILIQWSVLSIAAAVRLWRAGRGESSIAQRRVHLLSIGSIGLNVALILAGFASDSSPAGLQVASQIVALFASASFFIGFSPPTIIRSMWRKPEQDALRAATVEMISARTEEEVADRMLPRLAAIFGGRGAALVDRGGRPIGNHGLTDEELAQPREAPGLLRVDTGFGAMIVKTSEVTPYFGDEETSLLRSMAAYLDIVLERSRQFGREVQMRTELERANERLAEAQAQARLGPWHVDLLRGKVSLAPETSALLELEGAEDMTTDAFLDLVSPTHRDEVAAALTSAADGGDFDTIEFALAGERPRWVLASGRAGGEEGARSVTGALQDITVRKEADSYRRALEESRQRQRQALELNDNVVQGLTVAGMALDLEQTAKARQAISRTLAAARSIIADLLRARGEHELKPGDLVRSTPASLDADEWSGAGDTPD